jgi:hypothetical protein
MNPIYTQNTKTEHKHKQKNNLAIPRDVSPKNNHIPPQFQQATGRRFVEAGREKNRIRTLDSLLGFDYTTVKE